MKHLSWAFIGGMICFAPSLQAQSPGISHLATSPAVVPITIAGDMPYVQVQLGKGVYWFLIDTGADVVFLNQWVIEEEPDAIEPTDEFFSLSKRQPNKFQACRIRQMRLGDAYYRDIPAVISKETEINPGEEVVQVAGLLGYQFFANHLLTVDYSNSNLIIQGGALPKPDQWNVFSIEKSTHLPTIYGIVDEKKAALALDTGSSSALRLSDKLMHDLFPHYTGFEILSQADVRSIRGLSQAGKSRFPGMLQIGPYTFSNLPCIVTRSSDRLQSDNVIIVGGEFLKNHVITFDQKNGRLRLLQER